MTIYTSEEREILARLQVGQLMICENCGGQGYTDSHNSVCADCYGAGVMTPELRAVLDQPKRPTGVGTNR